MNATVFPAAAVPAAARTRPSWIDRAARHLVRDRLGTLQHGRIDVDDPEGSWGVGGPVGVAAAPQAAGTDDGTAAPLAARVTVHDPRFYRRIAAGGALGAAESFLDGEWSCDDLASLLRIVLRNPRVADGFDTGPARIALPVLRMLHRFNANTLRGSRRNIRAHYDLGNDFFRLFLDESLMYSSAMFAEEGTTLEEASRAKLERVCRKLRLGPGQRVLEIGTGWGGFALHAASRFGCHVTTTTISQEQYDLARRRVHEAGLSDRVTVLLEDYRELRGRFDRLVSIEMIEAVGHERFDEYFARCGALLARDGLFLLQGIVLSEQRYARYLRSVDFIQKHVFPGGCLPSVLALGSAAARRTDLRLLHLEDFAGHYARTLREWRARFRARLDEVRAQGRGERFVRMWDYYLCYSEAAFEERACGVVQMLFAAPDNRLDPLTAWSEIVP